MLLVEELRAANAARLYLLQTAKAESATIYNSHQKIKGLKDQAKQQEQQQIREWLPSLEQSVKETENATQNCVTVQRYLQEWRSQPAQFTVPWIQLDGKNLKEWLDIYNSLCAELHQLEEQPIQ